MHTKYAAYIFDLDGTLINSAPSVLGALARALDMVGVKYDPAAVNNDKLIGPKIAEIIDILNLDLGPQPVETKSRIIANFRIVYDAAPAAGAVVYDAAMRTLNDVRARGAMLFVATNKPRLATSRCLAAFGWDFWRDVYTPDKFDNRTMDKTQMVADIIQKYNLDAGRTLMLGDTGIDLAAAHENNMAFALATWGFARNMQELIKQSDIVLR